jgi:hypothetical protein
MTDPNSPLKNFVMSSWGFKGSAAWVKFSDWNSSNVKGTCPGRGNAACTVCYETGETSIWYSYIECLEKLDKEKYFIAELLYDDKSRTVRFSAPNTDFATKIAIARCDMQGVYYDLLEVVPLVYTVTPADTQQSRVSRYQFQFQ